MRRSTSKIRKNWLSRDAPKKEFSWKAISLATQHIDIGDKLDFERGKLKRFDCRREDLDTWYSEYLTYKKEALVIP